MAKDPVCGMTVDEDRAERDLLTSQHQGKTFFFCSLGCKLDFEKNPQQYTEGQPTEK